MGLLGSLKRGTSKVWNGMKNVTKKAIDKTVDVVSNPSKVWNSITGKDKFKEAEILLKEIEDKYDKAKQVYEKKIEKFNIQLRKKIEKINYHKKDIFENHFIRFIHLGNKLHNINIEGKHFLEYFDDTINDLKEESKVKDKTELYQIDFNNLSLTELGLGILTLGFFTRKKAKQTLIKVKEEEQRINEEIQKMESQVKKLSVVFESINNVAEYFEVLILNYSKLLDRFEYGISTQTQKNILSGNKLLNGKLNFKLMPIVHIEDFHALFNLSIVLKQMSTMGYLNENIELNDEDIEAMNKIESKINNLNILAA